MSAVATAIVGSAIVGGYVADQGSKRAIGAQRDATAQANQLEWDMYQQQRQDQQPWRDSGMKALAGLESGEFADNLQMDPGYQFRMNEGMKAINAGASARGSRNSGATMKALTRFGQDYASQEYDKAYNRQYSRLSQLAGFGNNASNANTAAAGNYGSSVANNYMNMGNAAGAANIAGANNFNNTMGNMAMAGAYYYGGKN